MKPSLTKALSICFLLVLISGCSGAADDAEENDTSAKTITALNVTPPSASIALGFDLALTAMASYSDGSSDNVSTSVTWNSTDEAVATVSSAGLVSSLSQGTTTVSASIDGNSSSSSIIVTPPTLSSIFITPSSSSIALGRTVQFSATGIFSDASNANITSSVNWDSSNNAIATVDANGLLSSHTQGTVTVTAALSGEDATATLSVTAKALDSIVVNPNNPSIQLGTSQQFSAEGTYSDLSIEDVTSSVSWSSNTTAVATISNSGGDIGLATSKIAGSTLIQAEHIATGSTGQSNLSITTPAINRAYVASSGNVVVIDTLTDTIVDTVNLGSSAYDVAVHAAANKAFITNNGEDTLTIFDISSNQTITTIGVGDNPQAVAVNPGRNKAYVLNPSDFNSNGTVSIINTTTNGVIDTVTVGMSPAAVTIADSGNASGVFIANKANINVGVPGSLSVIDVATDAVTYSSITGVGDCPLGLAYQPSTARVRVLSYCAGRGYISAIYATTKAVSDAPVMLGVAGTATGIDVDPGAGGDIYVAHPSTDRLSVTEYVFDGLVADIGVGDFPTQVAFDNAHNKVYVTNCSSGTVSVIDAAMNVITTTIDVGGCPRGIDIID